MKNLFLVINKEKIYAYVVSILTICTLFFMSGMINKNVENTETMSSNINKSSNEQNCVKNEENNVKNEFKNNPENLEMKSMEIIN